MTELERLAAMTDPLLAWYAAHQRTLPWRGVKDPYRVWVSEIMLQQTRVAAVQPYYDRWMEALPTVQALAAVDEAQLMKLWEGLGYYNRAKNLQRAARMILREYQGNFPDTYEKLLLLPGIGAYTAGAIASIAFGEAVPAVDGNVLRVAARVTAIEEDILDGKVVKQFRERMAAVIPKDRPGTYNQALMDLGAMVCLPNGEPGCAVCPLAPLCEARRLGIQDILPVRRKKAPRRVEKMTVYLLTQDGRTALCRRPEQGLLAGLWEFPNVPGTLDEAHAGKPLDAWGLTALAWRKKLTAKHIFSHVEWHMTGYLLTVAGECPAFTWADRTDLEKMAVPSAFAKFMEEIK